jgi:hypothetical protein
MNRTRTTYEPPAVMVTPVAGGAAITLGGRF